MDIAETLALSYWVKIVSIIPYTCRNSYKVKEERKARLDSVRDDIREKGLIKSRPYLASTSMCTRPIRRKN